jgi:hypothetical protein
LCTELYVGDKLCNDETTCDEAIHTWRVEAAGPSGVLKLEALAWSKHIVGVLAQLPGGSAGRISLKNELLGLPANMPATCVKSGRARAGQQQGRDAPGARSSAYQPICPRPA